MLISPRRSPTTTTVVALVAVLLAGCTDGGAGSDQVVTPPSPTPAEDAAAATPPLGPSPSSTTSPVEPAPEPSPTVEVVATGPRAVDLLADASGPVRFAAVWSDPTTAAELADVLATSEAQARDTTLDDDVRAAAAHRAQRAYRQLGREPDWRDEALAALPEELRTVADANLRAREALDSLRASAPPPETLPAWEIVPPAPATELLQHYRDAGAELGVDWEILAGINLVETRMGRIRGVSTAGARGPMQFIPASWEAFGAGGDIEDERDSIFAAARHLTERPGSPPSDRAALFNYNNHDAYGEAVLAYVEVLRDDPEAYVGYHGWQVYYTVPEAGDLLLPVGYREEQPVPIAEYLARPVIDVVS